MLKPRIIPVLLLRKRGLVKTRRFADPLYVGDPFNAVRIFNEKEVDELAVLDVDATVEGREPDFELVQEIVSEAFMPVAYGGGISTVSRAARMLKLGVEKIVVNTSAVETPNFVSMLAKEVGSQSVVVSVDVRRRLLGRLEVYARRGQQRSGIDPITFAKRMQDAGAGELLIHSVDRDGMMGGYDIELLKSITNVVTVPVIALGGAGKLVDVRVAVQDGGVSGAAAGSLFVFHGRYRAVLITYPRPDELQKLWMAGRTGGD
ncbi:MAG TPA: AglZ/HisF2 family acetamidino modification protein [Gemmatimonadaceae bacterium]|nr:AglZ/HisF2 family acetamidino modification protein [Gemmatimonadaceae bacterium]